MGFNVLGGSGGGQAVGGNAFGGSASAQQTPPQMPRPQRPMNPNSQQGQFRRQGGPRRPRASRQANALRGNPATGTTPQMQEALINALGFDINDPLLHVDPRTGRRY